MIKKISKVMITIIMTAVMAVGSITAEAAPKTMADGTEFDAEYYAEQNPDVVKAVGNSEAALYDHYNTYGKKEGRKAVADDSTYAASGSVDSSIPDIAEKIATAFVGNDYKAIKKYSQNFASYREELAPYVTAEMNDDKRYNISTEYGQLIIADWGGDDDTFDSILDMALAFQDPAVANPIVAETNARDLKCNPYHPCGQGVYGVNMVVKGDRWTSYVLCKSGYEYMEVYADGNNYADLSSYPNNPDVIHTTSCHYCFEY